MRRHTMMEDDEERKEVLAALAAGRDLGPEMDHALVDHYFEQRALAQTRALQRQLRAERSLGQRARRFVQRLRSPGFLASAVIGVLALAGIAGIALLTAFAATHGFTPWHHAHGSSWPHNFRDNNGYSANPNTFNNPNAPDPGFGFFPPAALFGDFFWLIPLALFIIFLRRRSKGGYQSASGHRGHTNQGGQNYSRRVYRPADTATVDAAHVSDARDMRRQSTHLTQPTGAGGSREQAGAFYAPYAPFDPF